ncbi:MAG: hypothetical protein ACI4GA_04655 [Acutalibacteraceae bacterium]|nr:hypothetical protein [Oscillospiraceae bacterium]
MARENSERSKRNTVVGVVVLVLAAVGLISIISAVVGAVSRSFDNSEKTEEYKAFVAPVIMSDPSPFDDVINADQSQLLSISIRSLLSSGLDPDAVEYSGTGMLIKKDIVEKEFARLFGTDVAPLHQTVDGGDGIQFEYNSKTGKYAIPITGVEPVFSPMIKDISEKGSTIILTVGCLAGTDWKQAANGDMIPPEPTKYLKIYLRSSGDGYYISSIKDTDPTETVATQSTTSETTAADAAGGN